MPFITAFMLWGSLAAAIPVAIHLFFRSRYRTVPWAAMKFLLTSVEQTSRRLKFQEYLLLLARIAVLAFLAVALARPVNLSWLGFGFLVLGVMLIIVTVTWILSPLWKLTSSTLVNWVLYGVSQTALTTLCLLLGLAFFYTGGSALTGVRARGEGDAVDAVFVFDTSFSMGAQDGAKTRIERAKEEAVKIIDELPPHSTVQIITCAGKTKAVVGPRSPGNLDQARLLVQNLELTHLGTDLAVGATEAQEILALGHAANKELYVFSDMQKSGFEEQAGALKARLNEIKEKTVVHFVRCGTRPVKNAAIIGITPQTETPRPKESIGFAVIVRNTGSEDMDNVEITLSVDGDTPQNQSIPKLKANDTQVVTLTGELKKAGLRVLTARIKHDDLDGDNRFDQVILVREQINILVVDGNPNDKEPEKASSFFLTHALLPVKESDRATYKFNPRVIPARLASSLSLANQDICILVNCSLQTRLGVDALKTEFTDALGPFVRKGHGLIFFSGDNINPKQYNEVFGKKLGLLPTPLKPALKTPTNVPFFVSRESFRLAPPAYWKFNDDERYAIFDAVPVWQHIELDDAEMRKQQAKKEDGARKDQEAEAQAEKGADPVQVIMKLNTGKLLAVSKKVDAGEVIFVGTAASQEGTDPKTELPNWTVFHKLPPYVFFLEVTMAHLMHGQTQSYNFVAGQTLNWYPKEKHDHAYYLVHPDGKRVDRLGLPEKHGPRQVVTASDLPRAGVYRMMALPRGTESTEAVDPVDAVKFGTPIAVIPDLQESADLTTLKDAQIDDKLGFPPIHMIAGGAQAVSTGAERLNREWTMVALTLVLALVLFEVGFAWYCGRAW